jgi:hypothetical protein
MSTESRTIPIERQYTIDVNLISIFLAIVLGSTHEGWSTPTAMGE